MNEVELVLLIVVVRPADDTRRQHERVDSERGHAELPAHLAEDAVAHIVDRSERVAHRLRLDVTPAKHLDWQYFAIRGIERPRRSSPAGNAAAGPVARVRDSRGASRNERRCLRPRRGDGLSGAVPTGGRRPAVEYLVDGIRAPPAHLPPDGARTGQARQGDERMAAVCGSDDGGRRVIDRTSTSWPRSLPSTGSAGAERPACVPRRATTCSSSRPSMGTRRRLRGSARRRHLRWKPLGPRTR